MTQLSHTAVADVYRVNEGRHFDPYSVLGRHVRAGEIVVRCLLPFAVQAFIDAPRIPLERIPDTDIFSANVPRDLSLHYRIQWTDTLGQTHLVYDPYTFEPQLSEYDIHLFCEGKHRHAYEFMGAHSRTVDGVSGILFSVWAPTAERISVVGDFNLWDGRCYPMRARGSSGIWELFIPELTQGLLYKFELRQRDTGQIFTKTDPYGRYYEVRPNTASRLHLAGDYAWQDRDWMEQRRMADWLHAPLSVYEIHLGSWRLPATGHALNYRDLAHAVVAYVKELGFTHIELLPITEHPFDGSWGYQTTGYFAPTSRYGTPEDFKYFVDYCHQHQIGVLLDWVPGHFPRDDHALARFDGTPLYEHEDPRQGEHREWGTLIFNYGRHEVRSFLISSALFWLKECHLDGLRVDAVASMLYLDYSRSANEWLPNIYGGNENLEAISFLRELNEVTHHECPGSLMIAEESTAWPQVTRPTWLGGLGFSMKWNMGWMHDMLEYMKLDPVHRHYHHSHLTFGLLYAYTENFMLPFSHDEVVHGKGPMIYKMPGDEWQRFANLRVLYTLMFTYPGKKLLFMGSEFAQTREWSHEGMLDWYLLQYGVHQGILDQVRDLNHLYRQQPALHYYDFDSQGFEWIDCHDASQSVLCYLRRHQEQIVVVVLNLTPIPRPYYRIGVPLAGLYEEIHNSDSRYYGGSNVGNGLGVHAEARPWMNRAFSIEVTLPPLSGIVLKPKMVLAGC